MVSGKALHPDVTASRGYWDGSRKGFQLARIQARRNMRHHGRAIFAQLYGDAALKGAEEVHRRAFKPSEYY